MPPPPPLFPFLPFLFSFFLPFSSPPFPLFLSRAAIEQPPPPPPPPLPPPAPVAPTADSSPSFSLSHLCLLLPAGFAVPLAKWNWNPFASTKKKLEEETGWRGGRECGCCSIPTHYWTDGKVEEALLSLLRAPRTHTLYCSTTHIHALACTGGGGERGGFLSAPTVRPPSIRLQLTHRCLRKGGGRGRR